MDCNKDEAIRAKECAEKRIVEKDFTAAKKYAIKAQTLYPELDGISQMLATLDVYVASEIRLNGENDFYLILGLSPSANNDTVKKQYRKLALILHPDKNKTVGAEGAFKFVSEAWSTLSDNAKRKAYDMRRKPSSNSCGNQTTNVVHNHSKSSSSNLARNNLKPSTSNAVHNHSKSSTSNVVPNQSGSNVVPNHSKSPTSNVVPNHSKSPASNVVHNHSKSQNSNVVRNQSKSPISHKQSKPQTFWTACSSCKVQFEYLRIYLNNRLCCQNCRRIFMAVETGKVPVNGTSPFIPGSFSKKKRQDSNEATRVTYIPSDNNTTFVARAVSGFPSQFVSEYPNVILHWSPLYGTSGTVASAHTPSTAANSAVHRACDNIKGACEKKNTTAKSKDSRKKMSGNVAADMVSGSNKGGDTVRMVSTADRPMKRMKVDGGISTNNQEVAAPKTANCEKSESRMANSDRNVSSTVGSRSIAPAFDARKLLIEMARTKIRKKLEEMKLASASASHEKDNSETKDGDSANGNNLEMPRVADLGVVHGNQLGQDEPRSISINVPDPDFYDFDKNRLEECFKPTQIWALYDDDDGMPRLYALIRKVISVKPFEIHVSYLNAKSNSEFAPINWVGSGFTKTCGNFRVGRFEIIDSVNVFSHVVGVEKTSRGFVQIYPKQGEIWAVYKNWSSDWDETTPDEVRHEYDMVEVLENYTEELGACVAPLVKSVGFKTVFERDTSRNMIQWIPRSEMFRFSHQVPSWFLKGEETNNLLDGCWDLDPAAMHVVMVEAEDKSDSYSKS
ncbi:uncharacterized protein LOC143855859 [Tasmannia lanceolata]|uniref:uncharacterized protein LOC143855859 n=1 Tax=Tasmannia lanceolata TaxID=3420 RepID=UPI00406487C9